MPALRINLREVCLRTQNPGLHPKVGCEPFLWCRGSDEAVPVSRGAEGGMSGGLPGGGEQLSWQSESYTPYAFLTKGHPELGHGSSGRLADFSSKGFWSGGVLQVVPVQLLPHQQCPSAESPGQGEHFEPQAGRLPSARPQVLSPPCLSYNHSQANRAQVSECPFHWLSPQPTACRSEEPG